jgi:ankyrin repeat protein
MISQEGEMSCYNMKDRFFQAVVESNIEEIKNVFDIPGCKPWVFLENESYTGLHRACFMDNNPVIVTILEEMEKRLKDCRDVISTYVNSGSTYGFRPLHYAAYRGNIFIIKKLIEHGADISVKNKKGLSVLHMAAQGDQPNTLIFFIDKYNMTFEPDNIGSTPLHWACYTGSDYVANLILHRYLNMTNINFQDKEGLTALHLAVISGNNLYLFYRKNQDDQKTNT